MICQKLNIDFEVALISFWYLIFITYDDCRVGFRCGARILIDLTLVTASLQVALGPLCVGLGGSTLDALLASKGTSALGAAIEFHFVDRTGKHGSLIIQICPLLEPWGTRAVTTGSLKSVDSLQLEILVIYLTKHSVLVVSSISDDGLEGREYVQCCQFSNVLDLGEAIVFVIFDNLFAVTSFKESRIWENELTAFELCWIRRQ